MATTTITLSSGTSLSSGGNSGYRLAAGTTAYTSSGTYKYTSPSYPIKITVVSVPWFGYSAGSSNISVSGTITVKIGSATFTGTLSSTTLKTNTNVTGTVNCTGSAVLTTNSSYSVSVTCSGSNLLKSGTRFGTNGKNLTGTWAANTYTVSYNANGHGTAPAAQTKTAGTALALRSFITTNYSSESTVTITGNKNGATWSGSNGSAKWRYKYTQTKWNTNSGGTGTTYSSGGSYTANAGATLYAIWSSTKEGTSYTLPTGTPTKASETSSSITVTFNANATDAVNTKASQTSVKTTTYSFKGWFTASSGGTQRTTSSRVTAAETVYAQFNSSTSGQAAVTCPTASQCTRPGYTLLGWSTSSTATSATYSAGGSYTPSNTITLYAVWSSSAYTLTYHYDDSSTSTATMGYNAVIEPPTPKKPGYKLIGWGKIGDGTSHLGDFGREMMYTDKISIHLKGYMDDWSQYTANGQMRLISCTESGGWNIEATDGTNICAACYDSGVGYKNAISTKPWSSLEAGWHTFDIIFNGTNVKLYVDQELIATSDTYSSGQIGYRNTSGNRIYLGAEAADGTPTGGFFKGKVTAPLILRQDTLISEDDLRFLMPAGNWEVYPFYERSNHINVFYNGAWKDAPISIYHNGEWKPSVIQVYNNNTWKET